MKKLFVIVSAIVLTFALAACGGEGTTDTLADSTSTDAPEVTEAPDTPEVTEPTVTEPLVTESPETQHVHSYTSAVEAATCTRQGKTTKVCECGDTTVDVIPMLQHKASAVSCDKDTVCTVCGTVIAPKTGHKMVSKNVITKATCSTPGKEKVVCTLCNYTTEQEIPTAGHVLAANGDITVFGDGYIIKCEACGQKVVAKVGEPVFKLTFEDSVASEADGNALGLEIANPNSWKIEEFNGSKALFANGASYYINIPDASVFEKLGTVVISFDYMSTSEGNDTDKASIFSFLSNNYSGKQTDKGSTGYGWTMKLVESENVISTELTPNATNSIAIERNKSYKIQMIIVPTARVSHLYVDGTYVGVNTMIPAISTLGLNNSCIRFGDGPKCGHVIDNFTISNLK